MLEEQEDPQEFLERLKENPEGVLADEYDRYRDRLWRIVNFRLDQRLLGRVDADDILQDTSVALWENFETQLCFYFTLYT